MDAKYVDGIDAVTGATRTIARLADVLGAEAMVAPKAGGLTKFLTSARDQVPADIKDGTGTLVGAVVGALLWRDHRVLGALAGASVGRNAPALIKGDQRRMAVCNLGITGAATIGALTLRRNPVVGFVLGWLGGGALAYTAGCNPVGGAK